MLPLQQAYEIQHAITEYLKATFSFKDKKVSKAFYDFIEDPKDGIYKGPYVSLKLPFITAPADAHIPLDIKPDFPPYLHQYESFKRLSKQDNHVPQPTIVTTGTSSGKTESFLYPLLDYCHQNNDRPGIKAIILYPMNALATDQAKRLAEIIWKDERLKGKITAGLFIGESSAGKRNYRAEMGPANIIEERSSIVKSPPDILLTNFKMLDFGLIKNNFDNLWFHNYKDSYLLQFLVLDELHTYDGAQGTDVANLIRRLKLKLEIPEGQLCPVGTSATIGNAPDAKEQLVDYAQKVFGETITPDAVITEQRQSLQEFMPVPSGGYISSWPHPNALSKARIGENETYEAYLRKQKLLWQLDEDLSAEKLSIELKQLKIIHDLLNITSQGIIHLADLIKKLAQANEYFNRVPEWDAASNYSPREHVLNSILTLVAAAKSSAGTRPVPFLYLQVQVWIRELSGVLRITSEKPEFTWKSKLNPEDKRKALPAYYCRDCGASGWLGVKHDNKPNELQTDINDVYRHFFDKTKSIFFINTPDHSCIDEYKATDSLAPNYFLNEESSVLSNSKTDKNFGVVGYRVLRTDNNLYSRHICPECNSEETLAIIGTRVATLSSICVSQVLSSNLDPRADGERKILAFTNSVQDAAHQAGFVEARNYRFTFRTSMQQVINHLNRPVTLSELQNEFIEYWKKHADETGNDSIEAYVYRFFPTDYRGKVNLESDYRNPTTKQFYPKFIEELDTRIKWEIISEFGYNARVGRTLEKSGASAIEFDNEKIKAVYPSIKDWLGANLLSAIQAEEMESFVYGLLQRLRIRGAIDHPHLQKFRTVKLESWDLNWMKDPRHFLNKLYHGSRSRLPRLIVTSPKPVATVDTTYSQSTNWYNAYFKKAFPLVNNLNLVNEFFEELFNVLESVGLLNARVAGHTKNYAIEPSIMIVKNKVQHNECSDCNSQLQATVGDHFAHKTSCLDYRCGGHYSVNHNHYRNYYQQVYNRTRSPRIYAGEHTGMLPRELREQVEISFKERPLFNSLNALVATSTLEMGIDIGTLNAAINNSVPPATSNFLQRVGRAGRSSGAALITNFALTQNHDLFHFEEPLGMMQGEVGTPGCFLEAKEILARHFFAFCLDCWAKADPKNNSLPNKISFLSLLSCDLNDSSFVINRFLSFVKAGEQKIWPQFKNAYSKDGLGEEVFKPLRNSLVSDSWYQNIRDVFFKLKEELLDLNQRSADIDKVIKERKLAPTDQEYIELKAEIKALAGIKRIIVKRSPFEHLINRGLLPNYAFPETGVKLQATIRAFSAKESSAPPVHQEFEIVRDAATALKELAPGNDFYGLGYKFHISGLNTYDWKDATVLVTKRFCSNCDYIKDDAIAEPGGCPKCGDPSWAANSNKHYFVKLTGVKSSNLRDKATLDDSDDERSQVMYRRTRHLHFHPDGSLGAIGMKDIPFGIEFAKHVTSTEVNLGLSNAISGNKIKINQLEDVPRNGFVTCRYCGKSSVKLGMSNAVDWHYAYCKHRDQVYSGGNDDVFAEVFLYRQFDTEALKILLPVQNFDSDEITQMFKAGIEAGLKIIFKGNPQHIGMWDYQEFNKTTQRFDKYLVLYDGIPGGTGYLEKLFNHEQFTKLLKESYLHIKECNCQHEGKDGCYRCIFTYKNQYVQDGLSRKKAEELFKKLVDNSGHWDSFNTGLGSLSGTGQIEESELEDRFIRSLKNLAQSKESEGWSFRDERNGTVIYHLVIVNGAFQFEWQINPQVLLGPAQGIAYSTRADFLMCLVSIKKSGVEIEDFALLESVPRYAIYLDGYTYHASPENLRFYKDVEKRKAIENTGKYLSWTLTWQDMDLFDKNLKADPDSRSGDRLSFDKRYMQADAMLSRMPAKNFKTEIVNCKTSFDRLIWVLSHPLDNQVLEKSITYCMAAMQSNFPNPSFDADLFPGVLFKSGLNTLKANSKADGNFYLIPEAGFESDFSSINVAVHLKSFELSASAIINETVSNIDKDQWTYFWQLYNLLQKHLLEEQKDDMHTPVNAVNEILQYYDIELHDIVKQMLTAGLYVHPEGGFFLNENGLTGEASLGVKDKKLFIQPVSDDDRNVFLKAGYTEVLPANFNISELL